MLANLEEITEAINVEDMANLLSWYRKVGFCLLAGLKIGQGEERGGAILIFFHKPNLMAAKEPGVQEVGVMRVEDQLATSCHPESCRNLEIALHSRTLTQAIS